MTRTRLGLLCALLLCLAGGLIAPSATSAVPPASLDWVRPNVPAGSVAQVRITTYEPTRLRVTAQRHGGPLVTLVDADVAPGEHTYGVRIRYTTSFVATTDSEEFSTVVGAWPVQTLEQPMRAGRDGRYHVYARGTEPRFVSSAAPNRPGLRCRFYDLERFVEGEWRKAGHSPCITENGDGDIGWRWAGAHRVGIPFRIRSIFAPGDAWNSAQVGRWGYFTFRTR